MLKRKWYVPHMLVQNTTVCDKSWINQSTFKYRNVMWSLSFSLSLICFSLQVQSFKVKKDNEGSTANAPVLASMKWSADKGFSVVEGHLTTSIDTVAWLNYTNAINATGWSFLEIKTEHRFPDKIQVSEGVIMVKE